MTPSLPCGEYPSLPLLTSRIARCPTKANYLASNRDTVKSILTIRARQRSRILAKVSQVELWLAKDGIEIPKAARNGGDLRWNIRRLKSNMTARSRG